MNETPSPFLSPVWVPLVLLEFQGEDRGSLHFFLLLILHLRGEKKREERRGDAPACNKRWQGDKLVLSSEIDYLVFPSSSYGSNTDALKHLNGTLEKTHQAGPEEHLCTSLPPLPHERRNQTLLSPHPPWI